MTTEISTSYQLGRFTILPPLQVDLKEGADGWMAYLNPGELTCNEFGHGKTPTEALADLESTIAEGLESIGRMEKKGKLGEELLRYRELLARCAIINGTTYIEVI